MAKRGNQASDYQDLLAQLDAKRIPRHIAIIMDGNGRWAARRHLPRSAGHKAGADTLHTITEICSDLGVKVLTVYAFSTENWKRPTEEVNFLMKLLVEYLYKELPVMHANQVSLGVIGDRSVLSEVVNRSLDDVIQQTKANTGMRLSLAINYGGRDELVRAVQSLLAAGVAAEDVDEAGIAAHLDTQLQPDPDLIIRPSGELRLSNFLLWQAAYSEFYFSDILWPDFSKRDLLQAVLDFQHRERRFGGVK